MWTSGVKIIDGIEPQIKHRPHNRSVDVCPAASTTNSTYLRHEVVPSWGRLVDLSPEVECRARSDGLSEQPRVAPEGGGYSRLLDPFVSTSGMDFHPHTERQQSDQVRARGAVMRG